MSTERRIAVSGASGLVGRALVAALRRAGHEAIPLVRRHPRTGELPVDRLPRELRLDAVVHLAGEPVGQRWTPAAKASIRSSRVDGTDALVAEIMRLDRPPGVLISASAVGYYGIEPRVVDERSEAGSGFLADLARDWEGAAARARRVGVPVTHLRIGLVLAREGGFLAEVLPAFRWGMGGPLGTGQQGISWIHLDDLVGLVLDLVERPLDGPINGVAPGAVPQADFARVLGRQLGRPSFVPAPSFAIRALFGEMGKEMLLGGALVRPAVALERDYAFRYPELSGALAALLGG